MKLFIDDNRTTPPGFDFTAQSYNEAVMLLDMYEFEFISLDYDLGAGETSGFFVLEWMAKNNKFPSKINIHSNYLDGVDKMRQYINSNFPKNITVSYSALKK